MKFKYDINDPFQTHIPVLQKVLEKIKSENIKLPILELGSGLGSTSILHDFCTKNEIQLITLDNNKEWLNKMSTIYEKNNFHRYEFVFNWELQLEEYADSHFSLVFIDQAPWEARTISMYMFRETSEYIILHDCDYFPNNNIFGKTLKPILSSHNTGKRDYSDVLKNWKEIFPEIFACPSGPPTLVGSQTKEINI